MSKPTDLSPIESSMFDGHHYDPNSRKMTVRYKNGAVWEYGDVGVDKYETFKGSASPGGYFNSRIKGNHLGRKVSE